MFKNLKNKKTIINFIQKKPYFIFEIKNFLSDNEYEEIFKNFPTINKDNISEILTQNKKYAFNSRSNFYKKKIYENSTMQKIHEIIFSKEFSYFFYKRLFKEIFLSRFNNVKNIIKILRFKRFHNNKQITKKNFFEKIIFSDIVPDIEYSYMMNGAKLVPHTDSRQKLISLMLYFPDDNLTEEQKFSLGTSFYLSKNKNIKNKHLLNSKEEIDFKKNNKIGITLPFCGKNLYGFIRNDLSWHTVEPFFVNENFIRKSININLYI